MKPPPFDVEQPLRAALDAIPHPVFVVDTKLCVLDANRAGKAMVETTIDSAAPRLCGETLQCIHAAEAADGCGTTVECPDCVFRRGVAAGAAGKTFSREKAHVRLRHNGELTDKHVLVTAAGFDFNGERRVLLFAEDVTDWVELREIIPICSGCKKIRNDSEYWEHVELFIRRYTGRELSHGLCPECSEKLYGDL